MQRQVTWSWIQQHKNLVTTISINPKYVWRPTWKQSLLAGFAGVLFVSMYPSMRSFALSYLTIHSFKASHNFEQCVGVSGSVAYSADQNADMLGSKVWNVTAELKTQEGAMGRVAVRFNTETLASEVIGVTLEGKTNFSLLTFAIAYPGFCRFRV